MDIIGFEDQIGNPFARLAKNVVQKAKSIAPMQSKNIAQKIKNAQAAATLQRNIMVAKSKAMAPVAVKKPSAFSKVLAKAKAMAPVAAKTAAPISVKKAAIFSNVLAKAKQAGKSVVVQTPSGIRKFTPKAKPFNLVPTASKIKQAAVMPKIVAPIKKDEVSKFQNTLQAMAPAREAQAIFNLPPTPAIVKNLDAVQRSYLKTDLPYQVISPNNFGQPKTKFLKNTPLKFNIDIDQIQPPVDAGMSNYYGK